tara:strand:+ start:24918 stop:25145 length:228 start_codon:yes stop_codon:yes gene_type:complete
MEGNLKFKVGDKVEVIKYGHAIWSAADDVIDIDPQLVGQQGVVVEAEICQNLKHYALDGLSKYAWYDEQQLKLVE